MHLNEYQVNDKSIQSRLIRNVIRNTRRKRAIIKNFNKNFSCQSDTSGQVGIIYKKLHTSCKSSTIHFN